MSGQLTPRIALELLAHEAIVPEAYYDSAKPPVLTWGIGVTDASGHKVARYKDNPQPVRRCIEVYLWLLREKYLPAVLEAFDGYRLSEHELGAALSFHYNTGAIKRAGWVKLVKSGQTTEAKDAFMEWRKPPEILKRRQAECDLFFRGAWSSNGTTLVYGVAKPSYKPSRPQRVNVKAIVEQMMGGS